MTPPIPAALLCVLLGAATTAQASSCWVYFGTSSTNIRKGIYRAELNQETGALTHLDRVAQKSNSVFLALAPDHRHLYALAEVRPAGAPHPVEAVETYAVDAKTGKLEAVGEQVTDGSEACHLSIDPSGRCLLAANYDGACVEVFPILPDATVGPRTAQVHFKGSGPNPSRQRSAHPHSINVDPSGRFAVVADLGQDRVFVYKFDAAKGTLEPNDPAFATVPPGSGPRHFAFHPDGVHAFVINELTGTITAFTWDASKGVLTPYDTTSILPKDFVGTNTSAEVVVSASGKFVYGSNRGDDSLVVSAFDSATGKLTQVQRITDGVKVPRNYAIDPSGRWLVCGNLTANNATVYRIDPDAGTLSLVGRVAVPEPLCVRFLQR